MRSHQDYVDQMSRQLGFLQRSGHSFDAGYEDEAIRIGVTLRVLFHDNQRGGSNSLMSYFNKPEVKVLATSPAIGPGCMLAMGGLSWSVMRLVDGQFQSYNKPMLGCAPDVHRLVPWKEWWEEPVYVLDGTTTISRRQIAMTASNKDGGAHVDGKLTPEYEALRAGLFTFERFPQAEGFESGPAFINVHLADLRQMAYEVLNSPDILALAN